MSNVKGLEALGVNYIKTEELPWIPYYEESKFKLIKANPVTGQTITLLKVPAGMQLPPHFHPGAVIVYTIQGAWKYDEYDWVSKVGDIVFEPAGTQHSPRGVGNEEVITLNIVEGTLDYLNENGDIIARDNWESFMKRYHDHCAAEGIEPVDVTQF